MVRSKRTFYVSEKQGEKTYDFLKERQHDHRYAIAFWEAKSRLKVEKMYFIINLILFIGIGGLIYIYFKYTKE